MKANTFGWNYEKKMFGIKTNHVEEGEFQQPKLSKKCTRIMTSEKKKRLSNTVRNSFYVRSLNDNIDSRHYIKKQLQARKMQ